MASKASKTAQNKEALLAALEKTLGIVAPACVAANLSRETYYNYYDTDPEFKAKVDALSNLQLDFVESKLLESIQNGSDNLIQFYLKTKGKKRGYGEQQLPETPGNTTRKLVVFSLRGRAESPLPSPAPEQPDTHPVIIPRP